MSQCTLIVVAEAVEIAAVSAPSLQQKPADAAADVEQAATDAEDFGITVEKKLTSEVTEMVTVTGVFV